MQSREQPPRLHLSPDLPTPLGERPLADARIVLSNPRFWWLLLAAVLVTAYAGPYYTVAILTLAQRLFYWGVIVLLCGIGMTVLSSYALALNRHIGLHWTLAVTAPALLVIYPVAVLCYALGDVMADRVPNGGLVEMMGYVGAPMVIINLVVGAFMRANWPTGVSAPFAHAPFAQARVAPRPTPRPAAMPRRRLPALRWRPKRPACRRRRCTARALPQRPPPSR